jgi:hypothetical protein
MQTSSVGLLRLSCVLTLVGLGFALWSLLDPTPIPVILAMSVAQAVGTVAFLIYLTVVVRDLRRSRVLRGQHRR